MKHIARIGALALLPFLTGCFDFEQTISVASNGTVTLVTEVAIETDMMAMAFQGADTQNDFCPTEGDAADLPPTFTMTTEQFVRDADTVCRITAIGPITDLTAAMEAGVLTPGGGDEGAPEMTLVDEGNGIYTYTVHISSQGGGEDMTADEQAMMAMMGPLFEGRFLTWTVTAPRILSVNDDSEYVTRDGNTVTLTVPALEMITGQGIDYDLNLRFGL